jgi:4-amino-4-deoxy-L-arabinose transferase-like glycosyltransferase
MKKNNFYQLFNAKGLLLIILLAFVIRMIFFIALQPWENEVINKTILVKDAAGYHQLALSLLSKKSFEDFDTFRTPGYPLFVAMIYAISSCKIWLVLFLQIIMNIASLLLLYKIASAIFSRNIALLSAFLFAIDPLQIIYSVQLLTDTLFVFLFLVSTYYLCNGIIRKNYTFLIISALALGLATIVRPISYLFPLVIIIFIFLFSNIKVKLKLLYSAVFTVIFIAAISPWLYHNYSKYGEVNLSSISGYNLLFYNVASTESYKTGMPIEEVRNKFDKLALQRGYDTTELNPYKNSRIFSNIAGEYIRDNFILYCKRQLMGVVYLYCASPSGVIASNFHQESRYDGTGKYSANFRYLNLFMNMSLAEIVITISIFLFLLINYLYSLYGIYLSVKLKNKFVFLLIFIILYFTILTGAVGGSRYRLPFMPFINILCAAGILYFYSKIKDKLRSVKK